MPHSTMKNSPTEEGLVAKGKHHVDTASSGARVETTDYTQRRKEPELSCIDNCKTHRESMRYYMKRRKGVVQQKTVNIMTAWAFLENPSALIITGPDEKQRGNIFNMICPQTTWHSVSSQSEDKISARSRRQIHSSAWLMIYFSSKAV